MVTKVFSLLFLLVFSFNGNASVSIGEYASHEFNPTARETFAIPVVTDSAGKITVEIYTSDGELLRSLPAKNVNKPGTYDIPWDGRDGDGITVPDEAYIPVVAFQGPSGIVKYDPREFSGGEEITISPNTSTRGQIVFQLDRPARVLARAGVKSGPMLKSIVNWEPRSPGRNNITWNGFDHDNLVNLYDHNNLALLVTGFQLPRHAIITVGNNKQSYLQWRRDKKFTASMPDLSDAVFERDGRRVSRHYYIPRPIDIDPRVTLEIVGDPPRGKHGFPVVSGPISLRVEMNDDDRWAMQQSLYEVAFFVDYEFLSEEEQGYVPLTWRWNPGALEPGVHMVTVNVSGFNGQVGVKSLQIEVTK